MRGELLGEPERLTPDLRVRVRGAVAAATAVEAALVVVGVL